MKIKDFSVETDGFAGHLVLPDTGTFKHAVIVVMGGEKSIVSGVKVAKVFASYGIAGISVPVFGAGGLPATVDRIPIDIFEPAVKVLKEKYHAVTITIYGFSMGTVYAALAARFIEGIDNVILCAPTHVPFEGTVAVRKEMTGHSSVTFRGKELDYVSPDFFGAGFMAKYVFDKEAERKVTNMWKMYRDAYKDKERERSAYMKFAQTDARILLIAGEHDEVWPSQYSGNYIMEDLKKNNYPKAYKLSVYPKAGHLIGIIPGSKSKLFKLLGIPLIGLVYRSFSDAKKECIEALKKSEKEIIDWIVQSR